MIQFRYFGDVKIVWFCHSGNAKIVWFGNSGCVGIVWWLPSGNVLGCLVLGYLGRRWFSLVFALGRREIHPRHLTFPESGQRLPSQTIRLPSVKMTREMSKAGSGYSRLKWEFWIRWRCVRKVDEGSCWEKNKTRLLPSRIQREVLIWFL